MASVRVLSKELEQKVACELWCRRSQVESDLCHHQNHLPDRLRDDGCGADNRAWMMSSRQSPTTMYRSWVWCTECSSLDVCGTLWTNLLPRTKNKATIEVFAGQPNEESVWETTTYCPSTRLVSRSIFTKTPISDDRRFCLCAFCGGNKKGPFHRSFFILRPVINDRAQAELYSFGNCPTRPIISVTICRSSRNCSTVLNSPSVWPVYLASGRARPNCTPFGNS